ncbi:SDR family NAD(P)-dependent oxidoreductase [Pelagicoccus enzymogenes]|uniref:SDR family NAD(P)-dependent oxidoreductase n=1 Tax=Pelagicoccus enzymogenes TaxID=2773457 RepID=UPI0028107A9D|nr:SDR family NAD(P)-dependent oxidoreductase [Pelagicoccus enzymogenes]MDQ8199177.1 SDR family NAD(P)-dependent oxidoreductase [Pelagicoccus enzymogenes]
MSELREKVVLVSGATGGIGAAVCHEFARKDAKIIALGRNADKLESLISTLPGHGHQKLVFDAQKPTSLPEPQKDWATLQVDLAIHALGGTLGIREIDTNFESWQKVFNANFHAIVELDKLILRNMLSRQSGRIIHLCSSSAFHCKGSAPYGAAKAALAHYSRSQGKRLARQGVIVFGFCPGVVESPNNWGKAKTENPAAYQAACESQPSGKLQTPEEIASNLSLLSQGAAALYAGCLINADGAI